MRSSGDFLCNSILI
uniref:Uncharacterized protein n=1 Tax=Arundo donax TaxID=35708 RepID=A0A0A9FGP2_ARUDO